jgi:hypothetical protein
MVDRQTGEAYGSVSPRGSGYAKRRAEDATKIVRSFLKRKHVNKPVGDPTEQAVGIVRGLGEYERLGVDPDELDLEEDKTVNNQAAEVVIDIPKGSSTSI